jgi:ElaA protein
VSAGTISAVQRSAWHQLGPETLHDLLALRINVFVVEQNCPYPELDGRDKEPSTEHVWLADDAGPTAYLRVLTEPDGAARVGRVCTRADVRGQGLARVLMSDVLSRAERQTVLLAAQEHLAGWYARFGFTPTGPSYLEDDIPHVPMRLTPAS